jgi:hypothetical protein
LDPTHWQTPGAPWHSASSPLQQFQFVFYNGLRFQGTTEENKACTWTRSAVTLHNAKLEGFSLLAKDMAARYIYGQNYQGAAFVIFSHRNMSSLQPPSTESFQPPLNTQAHTDLWSASVTRTSPWDWHSSMSERAFDAARHDNSTVTTNNSIFSNYLVSAF